MIYVSTMASSHLLSTRVYYIVKTAILIGVVVGFLLLSITSFLVRDVGFIESNPMQFLNETIIVSLLSSLPVIYIAWIRRGINAGDYNKFFILFIKIALVHIGFQISGIYSILFK